MEFKSDKNRTWLEDENGRQIWNGKEAEALRILRQEIRRMFEEIPRYKSIITGNSQDPVSCRGQQSFTPTFFIFEK